MYILEIKEVRKMYVTLQRWGNSQGIRIPRALLDALGLRENDRIELTQEKDCITVRKATSMPHKTLEERLMEFYDKPLNQIERLDDKEVDWGSAQGVEKW